MFKKLLQSKTIAEGSPKSSEFILRKSSQYLQKIDDELKLKIDKRLRRTFFDLFITISMFRDRCMGLLLSELGGYICGFSKAPAGTKRISNLLRSKKWEAKVIDGFFFDRTKERIKKLQVKNIRPLFLWDDSRVEKSESRVCEGLCSVLSSKGKRLTRIRPGFYKPPVGRICVSGFKWTGVFLSHLGGIPSVCQMTWWTTKGKFKEDPDNIIWRLLTKIKENIGRCVHVLDRGYANEKMLRYLFTHQQDCIIRWKQNQLLVHAEKGQKKTHLLARSFKAKKSKKVRDKNRKKDKTVTITWVAVNHPEYPENQLYLVIVRDKNNYDGPMYILTSLPIENASQAWEILFSYMHRWEAEQGFRFLKSEMGLESPRLWFWDNRQKLMAIVTLVYDFILSLLRNWEAWVPGFLRQWCHRTGKRNQQAVIPLYRLRMAISNSLYFFWVKNSG
mgnify:CR=1 FL=1